jgi:hypothetical protein
MASRYTQSESLVRQMLLVGEDPKRYINEYSSRFLRDFLQLLRTSHGAKQLSLNHFYQEYISNKEHIHECYEMAVAHRICKVLGTGRYLQGRRNGQGHSDCVD